MFAESSQIILMWLGFYMDTVDLRISVGMKSTVNNRIIPAFGVDLRISVGIKRLKIVQPKNLISLTYA